MKNENTRKKTNKKNKTNTCNKRRTIMEKTDKNIYIYKLK